MKEETNHPPIGTHKIQFIQPTFCFDCRICSGQQEVDMGSHRSMMPICDVCLSKLKTLLYEK